MLSAFLLIGIVVSAQKKSAKLSAQSVGIGETVTLTITAEGDAITSYFSLPSSQGVRIVNEHSSINNINGKVKITQQYTLLALRPGRWTIGPFVAKSRSSTIHITALPLEITGELPTPVVKGVDLFMQCDVNGKTFTKGEPIVANLRIYTPEGTSLIYNSNEPTTSSLIGFWHESYKVNATPPDTFIIKNGKRYQGQVIHRDFLFATRTGELTIPAYNYSCQYYLNNSSFSQPENIALVSQPIQINILDFPSGAPTSFSGLCGSFGLNASLSKSNIKLQDAITLTVMISGEGNLNGFQFPPLKFPDSVQVLPGQTSDSTVVTGIGVIGYKTMRWVLVPQRTGNIILDSINFTYFNPELNQYITLHTPPFELNVSPGSGQNATVKDHFGKLKSQDPDNSSAIYLLLLVVPVVGFGMYWWRHNRKRTTSETTPVLQDVTPPNTVPPSQLTLSALRNQLSELPPAIFIVQLYTVYHDTLCERAGIPSAGASQALIRYHLAGKNIAEEQCEQCIRILQELALLRYSSPNFDQCKHWLDVCISATDKIGGHI